MASGADHAKASLIGAIPAALLVGAAKGPIPALLAALGSVLGIVITPDLDQITISKSEWGIVKRVPVLGWAWMAFWDIYARCIPHRHFLSHCPLVGTVIRVAYLWVGVNIICVFAGHGLLEPNWALWPLVYGLVLSDGLHYIMDLVEKK